MIETAQFMTDTANITEKDVLSDAMETLDAGGAVFFRGSLGSPWELTIPTATEVMGVFQTPREIDTILMFHAVLRGSLMLETKSEQKPMQLEAGDLVLLTLQEPHIVREGQGGACLNMQAIVGDHDIRQPLVFDAGEGNKSAKLICGGFFLRNTTLHPMLSGLPAVSKVSAGHGFDTLSFLLSMLATESESQQQGNRAVVKRIADLLLVELLRSVMSKNEHLGWLGALHEPVLRKALAALHNNPGKDWTVPSLSSAIGVSTSGLTQRFRNVLDQSPMQYLTNWRMHVATLLLLKPELTLDDVAEQVGYSAVAAFSRAFKRSVGCSPGQWRKEQGQS